MTLRARVAVVGGGVSGLATTYYLSNSDEATRPEVTLIEGSDRLGGKVLTCHVAGAVVDMGPDTLVIHTQQTRRLIEELGLTGALRAPRVSGSYVWSRRRLRAIPPGLFFGLPERMLPVVWSGILSPLGLARASLDLVLPRRKLPLDASIGDLVRPRLGAEVFAQLVEPLLSGAYAGRAEELSAQSTVPEINTLARQNRSLCIGMRRRQKQRQKQLKQSGPDQSTPTIATLRGGLSSLVEALASASPSCEIRTGSPVRRFEQTEQGYRLTLSRGEVLDVEEVVFATPAFVTADLLEEVSPAAAAVLRRLPYSDIASVTLAYPRTALTRALDATGFLVPPGANKLLVGCSWLSAKWPQQLAEPVVLLRCLVGGNGDQSWSLLDDAVLVTRVHEELVEMMGLAAPPETTHVHRWPRALPQYTVGHRSRLEQVAEELRRLPGVHLTGAAYEGAGLANCVAQGERAAKAVLTELAPAAVAGFS